MRHLDGSAFAVYEPYSRKQQITFKPPAVTPKFITMLGAVSLKVAVQQLNSKTA
jgi:hypothetical protein